jgi:NAD(P)-dependent dehydrogenase (short-subunit alcohol dehydrogenase family)
VTGGTGGIGPAIVRALAPTFEIVLLGRRPWPQGGDHRHILADFDVEGDLDRALDSLQPMGYFGIIHMSVPPVRRGGLVEDPLDARRQWIHAIEVPIRLARWAAQNGSDVRRIALFGSTGGAKVPEPRNGAYSLAKACVDSLGPLLAVDLAARGINVNVIRPGFIAAGINSGALSRTVKSVAARAATSRVTEPDDIAALILFLLSDAASQIDGAVLTVDGGLLPQ